MFASLISSSLNMIQNIMTYNHKPIFNRSITPLYNEEPMSLLY